MNMPPFVIIGIVAGLILVGILAVFAIRKNKEGKPKEPDYRGFFILGICLIPLSITFEIVFLASGTKTFLVLGITFIGMGISYIAIGLGNRGKWQKRENKLDLEPK
ncbi:hypothetical protein ACFLX3_00240 [Chloroflexota bacterium]